jgi:hypothetical protein
MMKRIFKLEDVDTPIELEKRTNETYEFLKSFWRGKTNPNLIDKSKIHTIHGNTNVLRVDSLNDGRDRNIS